MKQNVSLDASLVHAAANRMFALRAITIGMTLEEAQKRSAWLKKQPEPYIEKVVKEVENLMNS